MATTLLHPPQPVRTTPAPRGGFSLGRPFGIELRLDPSWFLIAFLIVISLGSMITRLRPDLGAFPVWFSAVLTGLLFFGSILLHELSHSLMARRRGLSVPGITLFVFGGISRVRGEPARPADEFVIAIVGPMTSVVLGGFFSLLAWIFPADSIPRVASGWLGFINFGLAAFNLLPGYPLDGGRVLRAAIWTLTGDLRKATRWAGRVGIVIGGVLLVWGAYRFFATPDFASGIWTALVGWFLISAAQRSVLSLELRQALGHYRVDQVMRTDCARIPAWESLQEFVDNRILKSAVRCFLVVDGDALRGLITLHEVRGVARDRWPTTTVGDVMVPMEKVERVDAGEPLEKAFEKMEEGNVNQLPVMDSGKLTGMVTREDILRVLGADIELRGAGTA